MGDIRQLPNMGVAEFSELNYTAKKAYNVKGLQLQLQSVYPTIGLSLLFNRSMIVSQPDPTLQLTGGHNCQAVHSLTCTTLSSRINIPSPILLHHPPTPFRLHYPPPPCTTFHPIPPSLPPFVPHPIPPCLPLSPLHHLGCPTPDAAPGLLL